MAHNETNKRPEPDGKDRPIPPRKPVSWDDRRHDTAAAPETV